MREKLQDRGCRSSFTITHVLRTRRPGSRSPIAAHNLCEGLLGITLLHRAYDQASPPSSCWLRPGCLADVDILVGISIAIKLNLLLSFSTHGLLQARDKSHWGTMMSGTEHGKRLVAALIDCHAVSNPGRAWASIPRKDNDPSKGFVDLTYKQFANAINHAAWWLKDNLDGARGPFETLAYAGPKDLRYPIIAVAAVKVGKQVC
jgi:hypothetical protein